MNRIHHANVIVGGENHRDFVFGILEKDLNFKVKSNPDFLIINMRSFGIDDARNLGEWAMGKPFLGESKVSFITAKSITSEAQNAMLKVLEEPPLGTYFFISLESLGGLLPTFISRVRVLDPSQESGENVYGENTPKSRAERFLHSKIGRRLSLVQSLSKNEDKSDINDLLRVLEEISYKNSKDTLNDIPKSEAMKNILTAKILASARGSSPKMLLEWLSCVL